jgi:hypothetical protein
MLLMARRRVMGAARGIEFMSTSSALFVENDTTDGDDSARAKHSNGREATS